MTFDFDVSNANFFYINSPIFYTEFSMTERIEREREKLRKSVTEGQCELQGFSYLPLLASKTNTTPRINLNKLSTINLLVFLEESFKNSDKTILKSLDKIKKEIIKRTDLFISTLKYLENKKIRDEMFYWAPGYSISNIFSFIVELIPDFVVQYREYYVKHVVCKTQHFNVIHFIKERFASDYEYFNLIDKDLMIFDHCISSYAWVDEGSNKKITRKSADYLGIEQSLEICEDLNAILSPSASFVELTVFGRLFVSNLSNFDGLVNKDLKVKDWWIKNGLTVDEWATL